MSLSTWHPIQYYVPHFLVGGFAVVLFILFTVAAHDGDLDKEEFLLIMLKNSSCENLEMKKDFEMRKYLKDKVELKVIEHYLKDGNCS